MKVVVVNDSRHGIRVHAEGCRDVARERKAFTHTSDWGVSVAEGISVEQAVVKDLNDGFGWTPEDAEPAPWSGEHVRILPCCKKEA